MPGLWAESLPAPGFRIVATERDGTRRVVLLTPGTPTVTMRIAADGYVPIVVEPIVAGRDDLLTPAGAVYPFYAETTSVGIPRIAPTFADGPAVAMLAAMVAQGVDVAGLNVVRLLHVHRGATADWPHEVDLGAVADDAVAGVLRTASFVEPTTWDSPPVGLPADLPPDTIVLSWRPGTVGGAAGEIEEWWRGVHAGSMRFLVSRSAVGLGGDADGGTGEGAAAQGAPRELSVVDIRTTAGGHSTAVHLQLGVRGW